jgi:hypothetical protein
VPGMPGHDENGINNDEGRSRRPPKCFGIVLRRS